ncbi:MAG: hypothetical protein SFV21_20295 [Rhodospirillaceae bacterium]|nr:hypothetical protein [Rhodospirillaceae bacterium]
MDPSAQNTVQRERMRLGQVRKAFAAGIDARGGGQQVPVEFFGACVDYIRAAMDRLHRQDQRIHDILKPHVKPGDAAAADTLANLDMRLARSRAALAELAKAMDAYRAAQLNGGGEAGWAAFKRAVDGFMEVYFNVLLKGQHSTLEMQQRIFKPGDWTDVAGVNEAALMTEAATYERVRRHAPAGADPAGFKAGPPVL